MPFLEGNVLELGGGDKPVYHPNLDVRAGVGVDILADLNKPLPIKDGTFDGVYCQYAIEHISYRSLGTFVREISRVLKVGGKAVVVTANLKEQARVIASRDTWEGDYESRLIFGDQDYPENSHKCGLSPELAMRLFNDAGMAAKIEPVPGCTTDMIVYAEKAPKDRFRWIREQIPAGASVVDVGCSDAPVTWNMKNVTYVDSEPYEKLTADCVTLGRKAFSRENFIRVNVDAKGLPFDDKQFDIALATEIFEHVENPVELFREVARIARRVIITIPNEYDWADEHKPFMNPTHVRHYTQDQIERELSAAGYKTEVKRLDYQGWSFWTVVYDVPRERTFNPVVPVVVKSKSVTYSVALLSTPFMTVPPTGYGGLERIVYDLAIGLRDRGHDITVFAPNGSKVDGCRVVFTGAPVSTTKTDWLAEESRVFETIKNAVKGQQIIHGHNWFGLEYRLRTDKTRIIHTHHGGLNTEWWKPGPPFPLNLVAISDFMKRTYVNQGHKAEYVYNGVDLGKYEFYDGPRTERLLFVGRIDRFKQPHVAIEIAKKSGLGLDIVGGTFVQDDAYLNEIINACDGTQIKFWRDPEQSIKVTLMQRAKCLVFPSKMGEPFGLVAVESLACGTPVVALKDGAIPEIIINGKHGYVCETNDELAYAVTNEMPNPKECRTQAEKFGRNVMAEGYERLYERVLNGRDW